MSRARAILRVGIPLARPAILGGVALALMEALADFGTVNLLGVPHVHRRDLPRLVRGLRPRRGHAARHAARVGDAHAAGARAAGARARPARAARGPRRPRAAGAAARPRRRPPRCSCRSRSWRWWWARRSCSSRVWSVQSIREGLLPVEFGASVAQQPAALRHERRARAGRGAAARLRARARAGSRTAATAARTATIGYGLPGSVVAVAVIVPLGWIDRRLDGAVRHGLTSHGHGDRTLLRLSRSLPRPRLGRGRVEPPAGAARSSTRPPAAWAPTGSTCSRACTCRCCAPGLVDGGAARVRRGDEGAAGHAAAAAARRRHAWRSPSGRPPRSRSTRRPRCPALMIVLVGLLPVALMIRLSGRSGASEVEASPAGAGWESTSPRRCPHEPRADARAVEVVRLGAAPCAS